MELQIDISHLNAEIIAIEISGPLTNNTIENLSSILSKEVSNLKNYELSLKEVTQLDIPALQVIVSFIYICKQNQKKCTIIKPDKVELRDFIEKSNIDSLLQ